MPVGKGALVLGGLAGLVGLLALSGTASATGPTPSGKADDACLDSHMPSDMRAQVKALLESKGAMPTDLEAAALAADAGGYPKAAACLRKRAEQKRTGAQLEVAAKGGMPHIIRYGDIPSMMAAYYTGDPLRFKDLGPLNPQIGALRTVNGVTNYENWRPGLEILIPASWNPLDKPVPPPASGGGGGGAADDDEDAVEEPYTPWTPGPEDGGYTPANPEEGGGVVDYLESLWDSL